MILYNLESGIFKKCGKYIRNGPQYDCYHTSKIEQIAFQTMDDFYSNTHKHFSKSQVMYIDGNPMHVYCTEYAKELQKHNTYLFLAMTIILGDDNEEDDELEFLLFGFDKYSSIRLSKYIEDIKDQLDVIQYFVFHYMVINPTRYIMKHYWSKIPSRHEKIKYAIFSCEDIQFSVGINLSTSLRLAPSL